MNKKKQADEYCKNLMNELLTDLYEKFDLKIGTEWERARKKLRRKYHVRKK